MPALMVTIDAPETIPPNEQCTWNANVSGGESPLSYSWYYDSQWVGGGTSWAGGVDGGSHIPQFQLRLYVEDAVSQIVSDTIYVAEDPNAPMCIM